MKKKIFILDTSAIVSLVQDVTTFRDQNSPHFAGVLLDNEIVIPRIVLDELNDLRKAGGEKGKIAVEAARQLEAYSARGCLVEGVETEKGGLLRIAPRPERAKVRALDLSADVANHEILATAVEIENSLKARTAMGLKSREDEGNGGELPEIVLITQSSILRVLARSVYRIAAEELQTVCASEMEYERGFKRIELSTSEVDDVIEQGFYEVNFPGAVNDCLHLVDRENPDVHYCYAVRCNRDGNKVRLIDRSKVDYLKVAGEVMGRNVRQKLFLWMLMGCGEPDPFAPGGVRLVTVAGPAGSGKSFLTLAAAWERLERGHFERIVITRPMVDVGTSMGFLPGSLEEKLRPWGGPIEDNLRAIVQMPSHDEGRGGAKRSLNRSGKAFDAKAWLEMEDRLEMVPLTYIRGRTFRRTFVILEEAQNLERGPLKVLLTRLGEGSMVVVLGDHSQIDNPFLSSRNNGLVHAINSFRTWPQAAHMQLSKIVRSDLAQAATERL